MWTVRPWMWQFLDLALMMTSPCSWETGQSTFQSWESGQSWRTFLLRSMNSLVIPGDGTPYHSYGSWNRKHQISDHIEKTIALPEWCKWFIKRWEEVHHGTSLLLRLGGQFPVSCLDSIFLHCQGSRNLNHSGIVRTQQSRELLAWHKSSTQMRSQCCFISTFHFENADGFIIRKKSGGQL